MLFRSSTCTFKYDLSWTTSAFLAPYNSNPVSTRVETSASKVSTSGIAFAEIAEMGDDEMDEDE